MKMYDIDVCMLTDALSAVSIKRGGDTAEIWM